MTGASQVKVDIGIKMSQYQEEETIKSVWTTFEDSELNSLHFPQSLSIIGWGEAAKANPFEHLLLTVNKENYKDQNVDKYFAKEVQATLPLTFYIYIFDKIDSRYHK